jgi:hypothetical protein
MTYLVRIHIPHVFYLSPTYFVKLYVCAHTILYAHSPLTLLLVLLWTIVGFRVPVDCCILARSFRFSGLIRLLIWGFFVWFNALLFPPGFICCSVAKIIGL